MGLVEAVRLRWAQRGLLEERLKNKQVPRDGHGADLAGEALQRLPAPSTGGTQAGPPPAAGPTVSSTENPASSGCIAVRAAPAAAAPVLAAQGQFAEEAEVRGVCDGCGEHVMSDDEGRKREGDKYYHSDCIKGLCGGCGRIVHADAERVRLSGIYWHRDCV